jgi:DNA-binding IclR family transcriptional regulator
VETSNYFQSLRRAWGLLRCFTPQKPEWSGNEIAAKTGMHKTTAYRMLAVLAEEEVLQRNEQTNKYTVGPALFTLGSLYLNTNSLLSTAEPVIKAMNDLTEEVANLALMDKKGNITFVLREESKHALRVGLHVGYSSPAYGHALGKALLSELDDSEIDNLYPENLVPLTKNTVRTLALLKLELQQIRKDGVAYNNQQAWEGVEAVASVVRDQSGKAIAATGIGVPSVRMNKSRRKTLSAFIKLGAGLISYRLGYRGKEVVIHTIEELYSWWEQNSRE